MKAITKIYRIIIYIFIIQLNLVVSAQEQVKQLQLFDTYEHMKSLFPQQVDGKLINSNYFIGNVRIVLADNTTVTLSGLIIKVYRIEYGKELFYAMAATNNKGGFYYKDLQLGYYKIQVENRNQVVDTKYFFLNNNEMNVLNQIYIPVEKLSK